MTTTPDLLEQQIIDVLTFSVDEMHANKIMGDGNWTMTFKEKLAELGEKNGCKICTSGFADIYNNEWLFDMVWYKENGEKKLIDVPLVVESEWGISISQIKFDFEKLLLANSTHKLMICQSHPSKIEDLKEYFKEAINCYQLSRVNDRYLIAILDKIEEIFEFEVYLKI